MIAIGNALGYGQSLTVGYISALNREVTIDNVSNNMIQTDAAINFGNSGGALLDANGNLIGINSAKAADTGVEGMGYAIPINTASPILDELMNRTTRAKVTDSEELGFLGVDARDVSEEARQIYNLPAGAFVYSVVEGSPAEKAGIKKVTSSQNWMASRFLPEVNCFHAWSITKQVRRSMWLSRQHRAENM